MPPFDDGTEMMELGNLASPSRETRRINKKHDNSQKTEPSISQRPLMTKKEGMAQIESWCQQSSGMKLAERRAFISQRMDKLEEEYSIPTDLPPFLLPYFNPDTMKVDRVTEHLCKEGQILKSDICTPVRDETYVSYYANIIFFWLCIYRDPRKGLYVVGRNFFLLLLNSSAWPCLGPDGQTFPGISVQVTDLTHLVCHKVIF